jgi:hypothetical protein
VSLKSLLVEVEGHLTEMAVRLDRLDTFSDDRQAAFCAEERRLFERLIAALSADITETAAAA